MAIHVNQPDRLPWRRIGDIPLGWMREHMDASELDGHLSFHETGGVGTLQLMEMRLQPDTLLAPHSHEHDEFYYIVEGELRWRDNVLKAGGSIHIPAGVVYSFRTGAERARLLNFRGEVDHSFIPAQGGKASEAMV